MLRELPIMLLTGFVVFPSSVLYPLSFFEHFKLYQYVFVEKDILSLSTTEIFREIELPKPFPPLTQALPASEVLDKAFVV